MRTIKLIIQFDGTRYHGWQTQARDRTVQKTIQDALARILNRPVKLHGAGRTDAGVHALGQAAHFATDSNMDLQRLKKGVNSILPEDIVVQRIEEADADFHARYSARSRLYQYFIWNCAERSPFYSAYAWQQPQHLDLAAMRAAARTLVGVHDFSAFQGADTKEVQPVREVKAVRLKKIKKHLIVFEIEANAFLKHMVRSIVGTLVAVGNGSMAAEDFESILKKRDRSAAGMTAPSRGLFLKEVRY